MILLRPTRLLFFFKTFTHKIIRSYTHIRQVRVNKNNQGFICRDDPYLMFCIFCIFRTFLHFLEYKIINNLGFPPKVLSSKIEMMQFNVYYICLTMSGNHSTVGLLTQIPFIFQNLKLNLVYFKVEKILKGSLDSITSHQLHLQ